MKTIIGDVTLEIIMKEKTLLIFKKKKQLNLYVNLHRPAFIDVLNKNLLLKIILRIINFFQFDFVNNFQILKLFLI